MGVGSGSHSQKSFLEIRVRGRKEGRKTELPHPPFRRARSALLPAWLPPVQQDQVPWWLPCRRLPYTPPPLVPSSVWPIEWLSLSLSLQFRDCVNHFRKAKLPPLSLSLDSGVSSECCFTGFLSNRFIAWDKVGLFLIGQCTTASALSHVRVCVFVQNPEWHVVVTFIPTSPKWVCMFRGFMDEFSNKCHLYFTNFMILSTIFLKPNLSLESGMGYECCLTIFWKKWIFSHGNKNRLICYRVMHWGECPYHV